MSGASRGKRNEGAASNTKIADNTDGGEASPTSGRFAFPDMSASINIPAQQLGKDLVRRYTSGSSYDGEHDNSPSGDETAHSIYSPNQLGSLGGGAGSAVSEKQPLIPGRRGLKPSRSERLLDATYGPSTGQAKRSRRRVLRQVEKEVTQHDRVEKNKMLRAIFRAQQISEAEAKGAFTPHPQRFGTETVNDHTESTYCMVLAKTRHWKARYFEVKALHAMIINQFTISGLRCVKLPESPLMADAGVVLIGIKATKQQLAKELEHKKTENSLRVLSLGHSGDHRGTNNPDASTEANVTDPNKLTISPAEEILLTKRIINRALEVLRVHQGEKEKYIVNNVPLLECLRRSFACCLGCCPGQRYDEYHDLHDIQKQIEERKRELSTFRSVNGELHEAEVSPEELENDTELQRLTNILHRSPLSIAGDASQSDNVIKQVFALHNKKVNRSLWRLFWRELFCGLCCKVNKFDEYPMLRFCDEVRYHHGNEVAIFFAFASYTLVNLFILSCVAMPIGFTIMTLRDSQVDAVARGILGCAVLLIWGPIYLRMWDREYAVLVVRWSLGDGDQLYENPHDAEFEWKYDERLHRRLREYDTTCRPYVKTVFLPLAFIFLLLAMLDQTLFALWGAHQMTLPPCEDCEFMLEIVEAGPAAFYARDEPPVMPYDKFWYGINSTFTKNRTFEEFTFGWANLNNSTRDRSCLPDYCDQTFLWWDTCWDNPAGLLPATEANKGTGVGSPFIPFILLTVLLMRPISSVFQGIYECVIRSLTKLENWSTLEKYNTHYTQRRFVAYFLDVFWFNIVVVFLLVRFGPAVMHQELEICTGTVTRAVANATDNTVERLDMVPVDSSSQLQFGTFVDYWYALNSYARVQTPTAHPHPHPRPHPYVTMLHVCCTCHVSHELLPLLSTLLTVFWN